MRERERERERESSKEVCPKLSMKDKKKKKKRIKCVGESKRADRGTLNVFLIIKMSLETENT